MAELLINGSEMSEEDVDHQLCTPAAIQPIYVGRKVFMAAIGPGRGFLQENIVPQPLIEIPLELGADERILIKNPIGDNVKLYLSEEMAVKSGWTIIIQGRGPLEKINNLDIKIGGFVGRIGITCPDGDASIDIGRCGYMVLNCYMGKNSSVVIGDRTTCNGADFMNIESFIHVGRDCMFSKEILVQASPQHAIVSASNREILNREKRSIVIADHVWIGRRAVVLPKVKIDRGSVVGASAVVTRDVPAFVAVAGNPARVVKEDVTWSRNLSTVDSFTADFLDAVAVEE